MSGKSLKKVNKMEFKYNKAQEKFNELFDKHIKEGLTIRSNRQCGKTTFVINKAIELAKKGKSVAIFTINESAKQTLFNEFVKYMNLNKLNDNILEFVDIYNSNNKTDWNKYLKLHFTYTIYDEPWFAKKELKQTPYTFYIGNDTSNTFTVLYEMPEWSNYLEELKDSAGLEVYNKEFNGNIFKY